MANAEILLGAALLFDLWTNITKRVASICFFIFSAVALEKALHGYPSCGCFGPIDVNPWYIFVFDLAAAVALLAITCVGKSSSHVAGEMRMSKVDALTAAAGCAAVALVLLYLGVFNGKSSVLSHTLPPFYGSEALPVKYTIPIVNTDEGSVVFSRVKTSCGCSRAALRKTTLSAGEATSLDLEIVMPPGGGRRSIVCELHTAAGDRKLHIVNVAAFPQMQFVQGSRIHLGPLDLGEKAERLLQAVVHFDGDKSPTVHDVRVDSRDARVSFIRIDPLTEQSDPGERHYTFRFDVNANGPAGPKVATVSVKYGMRSASDAVFTAHVHWRVLAKKSAQRESRRGIAVSSPAQTPGG